MLFTFLDKYLHFGLLILRIGFGVMFILHGYPKIMGGPEMWTKLGAVMSMFGISFAPAFWGFMAAFAEFFGGILLIFGFFFRPACFLLLTTMIVATIMHLAKGDNFTVYSHALEDGIVFLSLLFIGPGRYSLDNKLVKN